MFTILHRKKKIGGSEIQYFKTTVMFLFYLTYKHTSPKQRFLFPRWVTVFKNYNYIFLPEPISK